MYRKRAVLVALVAATWLVIAGAGLLVWGTPPGRHPGSAVSGASSLGAAVLVAVLAIWSRPR